MTEDNRMNKNICRNKEVTLNCKFSGWEVLRILGYDINYSSPVELKRLVSNK